MSLGLHTRIVKYLEQPACFFTRPWMVILFNVIIPVSIMGLYEPFGYRLNSVSQLQVLLGYTIIVFLTSFVAFYLIPMICKTYYQLDRWTVGRNLLHSFLFLSVTALCIFIYDYHFLSHFSWGDYQNEYFSQYWSMNFLAVFAIGIFPLTISYLLEKSHQLKQNLHETKLMNQKLRLLIKEHKQHNSENQIRLNGDTKDFLQINPDKILYIESSGNYVDIYYQEEKLMHKMIRSTIKQMEEQLADYDYLLRCHRAFIVNVHFIIHIEGNAQGYRLTSQNCTEEIPVSRTYLKQLKNSLN